MADVTTDAFLGQGLFEQALPLRVLFTAYPNIVHILTLEESGISRVLTWRVSAWLWVPRALVQQWPRPMC